MDFFDRQNHAKQITKLLLFYFIPAVVLILLAVYFLVDAVVWYETVRHHRWHANSTSFQWWDWQRFFWVAGIGGLFVFCGSLYKMRQLADGGGAMAMTLGGHLISPQT